jgi:hypothetical protein
MDNWTALPPGATFQMSANDIGRVPAGNYAFVMNIGKLLESETLVLAPGHELRRASSEEISGIQQTVKRLASNSQYMVMPWEQTPGQGGQWEVLPEEEWRYFVISFAGTNGVLEGLAEAFTLAPLEFKIAFTVMRWGVQLAQFRQ